MVLHKEGLESTQPSKPFEAVLVDLLNIHMVHPVQIYCASTGLLASM